MPKSFAYYYCLNISIHDYPRVLFYDIPRVWAYFYNIPGSGTVL